MTQDISIEQKQTFINLLNNGIGVIFLHHSLASYQKWDEFINIIGGQYYEKRSLAAEDQDKASTYKHDVLVNIEIVDKNHPVTLGMEDFQLYDEVYGNFKVLPTVTKLLKTDHPESVEIIGWTNTYGHSRIVYLQPGHDNHAFADKNYRTLLKNAISWVTKK